MKDEKDFTIKDLMEELKKFDENLIVMHEGCDCYGKWNWKITLIDDETILIERYP